ncbi:MAG: pyridoxal phosphate-dependent aminotransferase [Saprospiraceae bacterium]|nr:pyridoxal phosphate-dependent aminotransferase [Saprospiraceae bacterium]|tara:strand:- start:303 stop:1499 length:1197 start_codon:yes stop_codon:yes gene_type:complete
MQIRLSNTVNNLVESATIKMAQMARDFKSKGHDVISLSLGEPDFDTPGFIIDAAHEAMKSGYTHYTPVPGLVEFREAIVKKLKRDNNLDYDINQIVVSNGAKQCIYNIAQALLDKGDEVVIFAPYWVSYSAIVELTGAKVIGLNSEVQDDYKVTADQLKNALSDKTKFILFSSPCNPTGSVYTKEELGTFAKILEGYPDVLVVSDEIYEYIVFEGEHQSIAQFEQVKHRTIVVNGMSKGFAMTGWRLGYMAAPLPIAKACAKIQGQVTSGATSFGQKAAAIALLTESNEKAKMKAIFKNRRDLMLELMNGIPHMLLNIPNGAFYLFPDVSSAYGKSLNGKSINNSQDLAEALLSEEFVATVAGASFGNDNCIRISYATSENQLIEAAKRIRRFFEKLK